MAAHSSQVAALAHKFQAVDFPAAEPVVDANPGWTCKKNRAADTRENRFSPSPRPGRCSLIRIVTGQRINSPA